MAEAGAISEELRQAFLVQGPGQYQKHYKVAHLACGRGEPRSFVNLILIAEHQGKVLVAVPEAAWGRTSEERILPLRALTRAVLVEVAVAEADEPEACLEEGSMKLWLGLLDKTLVARVRLGRKLDADADVYQEQEEEAASLLVPYGKALVEISEEHFAFVSAGEDAEVLSRAEEEDNGEASSLGRPQEMEQRLAELEGSLGDIQESLRRLLAREPQKQVAPTSKAAARKPALKTSAGDNFGLDPTVVRSARQAGIPEEQLKKLGALMGKSTGMADLPRQPRDGRRKTNVLSETEEEEAPEELAEEEVQGAEPVERAVLQLTRIVDKLAKQKKPRDLDAMLDGLDGGGDGGEGSSSSGGKSIKPRSSSA
jgi:hypothetical protein